MIPLTLSLSSPLSPMDTNLKEGDLLCAALKQELEHTKMAIEHEVTHGDPEKLKEYSRLTQRLDPFHSYKKTVPLVGVTNAFLKCWEMLCHFPVIPQRPHHHDPFRVALNAELPGAFFFAIQHYIKTKCPHLPWDWRANSLVTSDTALGDTFGLWKQYPEHWMMDAPDVASTSSFRSGDVTQPVTWEQFQQLQKVDLYTSDIGIGSMYEQEEQEARLNLAQLLCGLLCLCPGGHMITKQFMWFTPIQYSTLAHLTYCFDHVFLHKPMTSRSANSEIYVVSMGFKGINHPHVTDWITQLKTILLMDTHPFPSMLSFGTVPDSLRSRLEHILTIVYRRQCQHIRRNINYVTSHMSHLDNVFAIDQHVQEVLKMWIQHFRIPVE